MAQVVVTPRAQRDIDEAISALNLPDDSWARIGRSLRVLETFPFAGPELFGRWAPIRFVIGPWSWMILLYHYEESSDRVYVVAMHDGRPQLRQGPYDGRPSECSESTGSRARTRRRSRRGRPLPCPSADSNHRPIGLLDQRQDLDARWRSAAGGEGSSWREVGETVLFADRHSARGRDYLRAPDELKQRSAGPATELDRPEIMASDKQSA